ncbi:MAG: bifunctional hydroxymethylpyrimidine kinase/phosphomethylpyrimidine kinase [Brevinemataceae bacterium]
MIQYPILSIAGFDNSGGAGLQADLKVFTAFGCYGMTVATAIAAQNTTGVKHCYMLPLDTIEAQLLSIFEDITPKAVKLGMLFNSDIIILVEKFLKQYAANIPIVLDPVMIAKSGDSLLLPEAVESMIKYLIPLSDIITPNIPEANVLLSNTTLSCDQHQLAEQLLKLGSKTVLVKGGHSGSEKSEDILIKQDNSLHTFSSTRIDTKNTHGTGCTLSAAIAAGLAIGYTIEDSITYAKRYLTQALYSASIYSVGKGFGPTDHTWFLDSPCNGKIYEK